MPPQVSRPRPTGMKAIAIGALGFLALCVCACVVMGVVGLMASPARPPTTAQSAPRGTAPEPDQEPARSGPNAWEVAVGKYASGQQPSEGECWEALIDRSGPYDPVVWKVLTCAAANPLHLEAIQLEAIRMVASMKRDRLGEPPGEASELVVTALQRIQDQPEAFLGIPPGPNTDVSRESLARAIVDLDDLALACPTCARARSVRDARRSFQARLDSYPITVRSVQEYQLRHDELRGRTTRIVGAIIPDTYYNCKFRSTRNWRSFRFAQDERGLPRMHVYCRADDLWCADAYQRAVSGGGAVGEAVLVYPSSNRVCEESQAELVGFRVQQ